MAANQGVVKAFQEILDIKDYELFIPEYFALAGAAGAAFTLIKSKIRNSYKGVQTFLSQSQAENRDSERLPPLHTPTCTQATICTIPNIVTNSATRPISAYLGVDIGSISTNLVLMNEEKVILAKYYLMTASRPIDIVHKGFQNILHRFGDTLVIKGVGTTGSGRHLIGDLIGADVVVNEITAHARAAVRRDSRLHAVYLANFGCVNDSIYPHFFKREMGDKPFLLLEIDEHSAEAGVVTRCEAFLDAVKHLGSPLFSPKRVQRKEYNPDDGRVLYLPHAANGMVVWAAALRACGIQAEVLPPPDERSLHWGRKCLDGKECLPCTLMTGDMLRLIKENNISLDKAAFFMPGSCGSCRYDLFNTLQQIVFEDQGMSDVVLVDEFKEANKKLHAIMSRRDYGILAWQGFIAADILEKLRMHIRPYEKTLGITDEIYHDCLQQLTKIIEQHKNVEKIVIANVKRMAAIDRKTEQRPIIGLVGEAYLRNVDYASNNLIQKLEKLGAEVRMPAIMEVLWYTLYKQRYYKKQDGKKISGMLLRLQHSMLHSIEKKLRRHSANVLPNAFEPRVWDVIAKSGFTLDAGLGFGAAMEIAAHGVDGIVHAIPFNCVPGLMIQGLESRFRRIFPRIPFLTVAFHGQDDPSIEIRIEALVHQCKEAAVL